MNKQCLFCGSYAYTTYDSSWLAYTVKCTNCGEYTVLDDFYDDFPKDFEKHYEIQKNIISGIIRERFEKGLYRQKITNENFQDILRSVNPPKTIRQKLDKLILYIYHHSKRFQNTVAIGKAPAICYAVDDIELKYLLKALGEEGYISVSSDNSSSLKLKGVERAEQLLSQPIDSDQCFVAMWFDKEVEGIFEKFIIPAVEAKTLEGKEIPGERRYKAIKIDLKEFNDEILDNIISEIRKSRFVIADFTGNRGGVYYESGFAYGFGLDVIYTCKKSWLDKLHFDVNHKNYIVWETGEELYKKLRSRISATII